MQIHLTDNSESKKKPKKAERKKAKKMYLDSAATKSLFCDRDLLNGVRKSKYKTEIQTNVGTGQVTEEGDVPGFQKVMFSEQAIANLLALNELCEHYHVTFNSKKENAFNVRLDDGRIMKFKCDEDGIYAFSPGEETNQGTQRKKKNSNRNERSCTFRLCLEG